MLKIRTVFLLSIMLFAISLAAQVPYIPFPKNLSWHIYGESFNYMSHPNNFSISSEDIIIEDKTYTKVFGYGELVAGVREENKKVYAYFPEYGEHLLYDFNLEIGDTIFYNIGLKITWGVNIGIACEPVEHYAVVKEKGTISLHNGDVRNTMKLETSAYWLYWLIDPIQWIEGLGAITMTGLLDPLLFDLTTDIYAIGIVCICEENNAAGCLLHYSDIYEIESHFYNWFGNNLGMIQSCPCAPNSVLENGKDKVLLYPNPNKGEFVVECGELRVEKIEISDVFGRKHNVGTLNHLSAEIRIDITHLPVGVYFVKIYTESGEVVRKVLKE